MILGHKCHQTREKTEQYCGYNWDTGEQFEGLFLTAEQAEQKRRDGFMVLIAARIEHGLCYGA